MPDTSGRRSRTPLAYFDPASCSWRTSQTTLFSDSMPSSPTLPRWGTTRRGELYELPTPVLATLGPGCSSLLPTPLNADGGGPRGSSAGWGLRNVSRQLLPTPAARDGDSRGAQSGAKRKAQGHQVDLPEAIRHLLPTPTTTQRGTDANLATRTGAGPNLHNVVALLPTPRATDGTKGGPNQRGSSGDLMLPSAVMQLAPSAETGAPLTATTTAQPSDAGTTSPDASPTQPNREDEADDG
jgi:hypothetical protein